MGELRLSVQIPTWKRNKQVCLLIESLCNQILDTSLYEILICDSGSNDGTKESIYLMIEKYPNVALKYYDIDVNTLSAKRNYMFYRTDMEIVLTLDDDIGVDSNFLNEHYIAHNITRTKSKRKIIYCGRVTFPKAWISESNYYKYRESKHLDVADENGNIFMNRIVVMNMSLRKDLYHTNMFMNEKFIKYGGEDAEFEFRLMQLGFCFKYLSEAIVYHFESSDMNGYLKKLYSSTRYGGKNLLDCFPNYEYRGNMKYLHWLTQNKIWLFFFTIFINSFWCKIILFFLKLTDRFKCFYSSYLFQYVCTKVLIDGFRDQKKFDDKKEWI